MHEQHTGAAAPVLGPALTGLVLLALLGGYLVAVVAAHRRQRRWPRRRTAAWCAGLACAGLACAAAALPGPAGGSAHGGFLAHMTAHLLLGMLAPLLLVLAAPVTLLLRALPVRHARRVSRVAAAVPVRVLSHPVTAAALNAGGLWLFYTTGLYAAAGEHPAVHLLVQAHVFAAGYLLTAGLLAVDPAPHRVGYPTRAAVLVAFLAAHGILAKHLYAHPPIGVTVDEAQAGAMLMYYAGDLVDLVIIVLLCRRWYAATRPRPVERSGALRTVRVAPFTEKTGATHTFG